jgi:FKBP-type peptidyl-prolyl cis-trans isomerase
MRPIFQILLIALLYACSGRDNEPEEIVELPKLEFNTFDEKISYCIGLDHAYGCYKAYTSHQTEGKFDIPQMRQGMTDYLDDKDLRIPLTAVDSLINGYLGENGEVNEDVVSKVDASYAIGLSEGEYLVGSLVSRGIDQNMEVFFLVQGVNDGMSQSEPSVPYHEASKEVRNYYNEINLEMGQHFLENNAAADSVKTTESGLQYKMIKKGSGKTPNLTDTCVVHYTGHFIDGRAFESTIPSGEPGEFVPVAVIPGWQEGLMLMQEGGQCRLFIPWDLGYGEAGSGPIPPYSALVFDIELLEVKRFN